jgi:hypothetical protein
MLSFIGSLCFGAIVGQRLKIFGLFLLTVLVAVIAGVAAIAGVIRGFDVLFAVLGLQAGYVIGVVLPDYLGLRRRQGEPDAVKRAGKSHLGIFRL